MNDESIREAITVVTNAVNYMSGDANEKDYRVLIELAQQYLDAGEMVEEMKDESSGRERTDFPRGFNTARHQCLAVLAKQKDERIKSEKEWADKVINLQIKLDQMSKSAGVESIETQIHNYLMTEYLVSDKDNASLRLHQSRLIDNKRTLAQAIHNSIVGGEE